MAKNPYVSDEFVTENFFAYKLENTNDYSVANSVAKFFPTHVPETRKDLITTLTTDNAQRETYFKMFTETTEILQKWIQENMENPKKHLDALHNFYDRFTDPQPLYSEEDALPYFHLYQIAIPTLEYIAKLLDNNALDMDNRRAAAANLFAGIGNCGPGAFSNILDCSTALASTLKDDLKWQERRKAYVQQAITEAMSEINKEANKVVIPSGNEIHYVVRITNELAEDFKLEKKKDHHSLSNRIVIPTVANNIRTRIKAKIAKAFVAENIINDLVDEIQPELQQATQHEKGAALLAVLTALGPEQEPVYTPNHIMISEYGSEPYLTYDAKETIFLSIFNRLSKKDFFDTSKVSEIKVDDASFSFYPDMSLKFSNGFVQTIEENPVSYLVPFSTAIINEFSKTIFPTFSEDLDLLQLHEEKVTALELHKKNLQKWIIKNLSDAQKSELQGAINSYLLSNQFDEDYEANVDEIRTHMIALTNALGVQSFKDAQLHEGILLEMLREEKMLGSNPTHNQEELLVLCAKHGYVRLLKYLHEENPNLLAIKTITYSSTDNRIETDSLLNYVLSAERPSEAMVKYLIDSGMNVNKPDRNGVTPLAIINTQKLQDIGQLVISHDTFDRNSSEALRVLGLAINTNEDLATKLIKAGTSFMGAENNSALIRIAITEGKTKALDTILQLNSKNKLIDFNVPIDNSKIVDDILNSNNVKVMSLFLNNPNIEASYQAKIFERLLRYYSTNDVTRTVKLNLIRYAAKHNLPHTARELIYILDKPRITDQRLAQNLLDDLRGQLALDKKIDKHNTKSLEPTYNEILRLAAISNYSDVIKIILSAESKFPILQTEIQQVALDFLTTSNLATFKEIIRNLDIKLYPKILLAAIKLDQKDKIAHLIEARTNLNFINDKGFPLLSVIAANITSTNMNLLLEKANSTGSSLDINVEDLYWNTPIYHAIRNPDASVFKSLLNHKDFDWEKNNFIKILWRANQNKSIPIIEALLDIDKDKFRKIISKSSFKTNFVKSPSNIRSQDYLKDTMALFFKHKKYDLAFMLLAKTDNKKNLLLHALEKNDLDFLHFLNTNQTNYFTNKKLSEALKFSITSKQTEFTKILLNHPNCDFSKPAFQNILKGLIASKNANSNEILTLFIKQGIPLDILIDGKSLSYLAVEANNAFALQILSENKARFSTRFDANTPLELAIKTGKKDLVDIILSNPHSAKFMDQWTLAAAAQHDREIFTRIVRTYNYNSQINTDLGPMHLIQFFITQKDYKPLANLMNDMTANSNPWKVDLTTITAQIKGQPHGGLIEYVSKNYPNQELLKIFIEKYLIDLSLVTNQPINPRAYKDLETLVIAYQPYFATDKQLAAAAFTFLLKHSHVAEAKVYVLDNISDLELNADQVKVWQDFCTTNEPKNIITETMIDEVKKKSSVLYPFEFITDQFDMIQKVNSKSKEKFIEVCKINIPRITNFEQLNQLENLFRSKSLSNSKVVGFFRKVTKIDNHTLKTLVEFINAGRQRLDPNQAIGRGNTSPRRN